MKCFELKLANVLARRISSKLVGYDFITPSKEDFRRQSETVKDCVTYGATEWRILGDNRFSATLTPSVFSVALSRDYADGINRIKRLAEASDALGSCVAWQIVSRYYTGFFAAIEILKAGGEFVSYFDNVHLCNILQKSTTNGKLEAGTYLGKAAYDERAGHLTITYTKSAVRHHQYAWRKIAELADSEFSSIASNNEELQAIRNVSCALFDRRPSCIYESPSDTRNHWNYEDSRLFGNLGKSNSAEFSKLMTNPRSRLKWINRRSGRMDLAEATSSLGFASEFLKSVAIILNEKISPL